MTARRLGFAGLTGRPATDKRSAAGRSRRLVLETLEPRALLNGQGLLSGTVFDDLDRDRVRDPGEPGLSGWTVQLERVGTNNTPVMTYTNPTPDEWSQFGRFVTTVGNNILVASHHDDAPGPADAGAVYLFDGQTGQLLHTFTSPEAGERDAFGRAIGALGDDVLIGAPLDDAKATDAGAVYLFDGQTGELLHKFFSPAPNSNDQFGRAVASVGDNVLVGARLADAIAPNGAPLRDVGAAFLFDGHSGQLLQTYTSPRPSESGQFGYSVAPMGNNVLIGARTEPGPEGRGTVYLFDGATGNLLQTFSNPTRSASYEESDFGKTVAAIGNNVLVGARFDDSGADGAGAAFIFDGATGELLHTLTSPTPVSDEEFGFCVAAFGNDALVGARWDNRWDEFGEGNGGAVYLFDGSSGDLLRTLANPTPRAWDAFGISVATLGDQILVGTQTGNSVYRFDIIKQSSACVSDANGHYEFSQMTSGRYRITQTIHDGFVQTFPAAPGTYIVTVDVEEVLAGLDFGNVRDRVPRAENVQYLVSEDGILTIAASQGLLSKASDPDGDPLTVRLVNAPSHATLDLLPDGSFVYTPHPNYSGSDSFTYRVNDGAADSKLATVTVTVDPVNDAPVASDDALLVPVGTTCKVEAPGVLADDVDVDGDPLTAEMIAQANHGTVILIADGSFTYTPEPGYLGPDSFTYQASDGRLRSSTAIVRLTIIADVFRPNLRITELNYSPYKPTASEYDLGFHDREAFEFIELRNTGSQRLDLTGVHFSQGVEYAVDVAAFLDPGDHAVLVRDRAAFETRYGTGIPILGQYRGDLANQGERIVLRDPFDQVILSFTYSNEDSWPCWTDGFGSTLEVVNPQGDYGDAANWRGSTEYGGSPGRTGSGPLSSVVINEVLTHSNLPLTDSIELLNRTDRPIDISGWYLSDSAGEFKKFRIPEGSIIPAGGYLVFDEYDFNPGRWHPGQGGFALDGSRGDDVWLVAADAAGNLTSFVDHVEFDASLNGESFGRWPTPTDPLYPMQSLTLGAANSGPRVGPLVISEVMYNPPTVMDIDPDDLEFVEIYNPTATPVDLANWNLRGGLEYDFPDRVWPKPVILNPGATLVFVTFDPAPDSVKLAAFRTTYGIDNTVQLIGPCKGHLDNTAGIVRLMRPDYPPSWEPHHWPHVVEDVVIYADSGQWPTEADGEGSSLNRRASDLWGNYATSWVAASPTPGTVDLQPRSIAISELNYNPCGPTADELAVDSNFNSDAFEFIELMNFGTKAVDLTGAQFTQGVTFRFPATVLDPGQRLVVAKNPAAFHARYGDEIPVAGPYDGVLKNSGERIVLVGASGVPIVTFEYDTSSPWPQRADGRGSSLELIDPHNAYHQSTNWRASSEYGGSPGWAGRGPIGSVVINEVFSSSNPPAKDAIELLNPTAIDIDLGGWYLSDSAKNCLKYRIPDGTRIAAGGYVVFDEDDFNPTPTNPQLTDFALSSTSGDEVVLVRPGAPGGPLTFIDHVAFSAAATGESFGRWPNALGPLYPMRSRTLGSANSGPRVGPLVISEVMYHPRDPGDTINPSDLEYIEIYNPTTQHVSLANWRIGGGVSYDFAPDVMLASGQSLLVVRFDPTSADLLATFRQRYKVPQSVLIVGGYSGSLGNDGDVVQLLRAGTPPADDPGYFPMLLEDELVFDDGAPWPIEADGYGESLHRLGVRRWGNDVASWLAAEPTAGDVHPTLYWDGLADGRWDELQTGKAQSRWIGGGGKLVCVYPSEGFANAVVRSNTVTVTASQSVHNLTVGSGTLAVSPNASLSVANDLAILPGATYACQFAGSSNGLVVVMGAANLNGALSLAAVDRWAGPTSFSDRTRTILVAMDGIQGTFAQVPSLAGRSATATQPVPGHLGRGVFLTDQGNQHQAVTYSSNAVMVDLFQAIAGDTDGDRDVDAADIQRILRAAKFNTGKPADWTEGDFSGDGLVTMQDIQLVLATSMFNRGNYTTLPHLGNQSLEPSRSAKQTTDAIDALARQWALSESRQAITLGSQGQPNSARRLRPTPSAMPAHLLALMDTQS